MAKLSILLIIITLFASASGARAQTAGWEIRALLKQGTSIWEHPSKVRNLSERIQAFLQNPKNESLILNNPKSRTLKSEAKELINLQHQLTSYLALERNLKNPECSGLDHREAKEELKSISLSARTNVNDDTCAPEEDLALILKAGTSVDHLINDAAKMQIVNRFEGYPWDQLIYRLVHNSAKSGYKSRLWFEFLKDKKRLSNQVLTDYCKADRSFCLNAQDITTSGLEQTTYLKIKYRDISPKEETMKESNRYLERLNQVVNLMKDNAKKGIEKSRAAYLKKLSQSPMNRKEAGIIPGEFVAEFFDPAQAAADYEEYSKIYQEFQKSAGASLYLGSELQSKLRPKLFDPTHFIVQHQYVSISEIDQAAQKAILATHENAMTTLGILNSKDPSYQKALQLIESNRGLLSTVLMEDPSLAPMVCSALGELAAREKRTQNKRDLLIYGGSAVSAALVLTGVGWPMLTVLGLSYGGAEIYYSKKDLDRAQHSFQAAIANRDASQARKSQVKIEQAKLNRNVAIATTTGAALLDGVRAASALKNIPKFKLLTEGTGQSAQKLIPAPSNARVATAEVEGHVFNVDVITPNVNGTELEKMAYEYQKETGGRLIASDGLFKDLDETILSFDHPKIKILDPKSRTIVHEGPVRGIPKTNPVLPKAESPLFEIPQLGPVFVKETFKNGKTFTHIKLSKTELENAKNIKPKPYIHPADQAAADGGLVFQTSGINSNETLKKIHTIGGVPLDNLTRRARPSEGGWGFPSDEEDYHLFAELVKNEDRNKTKNLFSSTNLEIGIRRSYAGWLSPRETMRDRLITDNTLVTSSYGLTHQMVADPLLDIIEKAESFDSMEATFQFVYNGRKYLVEAERLWEGSGTFGTKSTMKSGWKGMKGMPFVTQGSLFNDELFSNWQYKIIDIESGKLLKGDALTPHLIHRYGFYQGGPYRMDPKEIIQFFRLTDAPIKETKLLKSGQKLLPAPKKQLPPSTQKALPPHQDATSNLPVLRRSQTEALPTRN